MYGREIKDAKRLSPTKDISKRSSVSPPKKDKSKSPSPEKVTNTTSDKKLDKNFDKFSDQPKESSPQPQLMTRKQLLNPFDSDDDLDAPDKTDGTEEEEARRTKHQEKSSEKTNDKSYQYEAQDIWVKQDGNSSPQTRLAQPR